MPDLFALENCPLDFYCSKTWDELIDTENVNTKFCLDCKKEVKFCETTEDFENYSKQGICVAFRFMTHAETEELKNQKWELTLGLPKRNE